MGSVLCEHCPAACCRYLAIPIDEPTTGRDFDDIRWYLMHQGVTVFVEDGDWYFQVQTVCKNLGVDHRCGVYETRPEICREYKAKDCDYSDATYGYEKLFTHPTQIEEYYKAKTGKTIKKLKKPPARRIPKRKMQKV